MVDWKIHKKLLDAGGLGPVVYIIPGRANGTSFRAYKQYLELISAGRTVVYVSPEKHKRLVGGRSKWVLVDRDVLTPEGYERAERIWNAYWENMRTKNILSDGTNDIP
jgi:hypothetical protein